MSKMVKHTQVRKHADGVWRQCNDDPENPDHDETLASALLGDEPELTYEVAHADLTKYPDFQLEGRLRCYAQEYLFERNPDLRRAFKIEMEKTESEMKRRKMYRTAEAERVFEL